MKSLPVAYAIKRKSMNKGGMSKCYADGGEVKSEMSMHNAPMIAKAIMAKRMAKGGEVDSSEEALHDADMFESAEEMHSEGPMDNEEMPIDEGTEHDDFLSPEMKRKQLLSKIFSGMGE